MMMTMIIVNKKSMIMMMSLCEAALKRLHQDFPDPTLWGPLCHCWRTLHVDYHHDDNDDDDIGDVVRFKTMMIDAFV